MRAPIYYASSGTRHHTQRLMQSLTQNNSGRQVLPFSTSWLESTGGKAESLAQGHTPESRARKQDSLTPKCSPYQEACLWPGSQSSALDRCGLGTCCLKSLQGDQEGQRQTRELLCNQSPNTGSGRGRFSKTVGASWGAKKED